jgi:REP element-mobilizing transposase RayT
MDRCWLLTWTTYGTWLPGDPRGCVTRVREGADPNGPRIEHDVPGTPYLKNMPGLVRASRAAMKGEPIWLKSDQAQIAALDLSATARFRGWGLLAGAVMANHVHLVVGVLGDPEPAKLLQIFKSYASRALNQRWGSPAGGTWWTQSGSRRKLGSEPAIVAAVRYVEAQAYCLARCEVVSMGDSRGTPDMPRTLGGLSSPAREEGEGL